MLNIRSKWVDSRRDLKVDDLVLAISTDQPRRHWPLGRITEVFPEKDSHFRVTKMQIGKGTIVRPITKLARLDIGH